MRLVAKMTPKGNKNADIGCQAHLHIFNQISSDIFARYKRSNLLSLPIMIKTGIKIAPRTVSQTAALLLRFSHSL
jgi:hypothetical protein